MAYVGILPDEKLLMVEYADPMPASHKGWWIPYEELRYGQDPTEVADKLVREMDNVAQGKWELKTAQDDLGPTHGGAFGGS